MELLSSLAATSSSVSLLRGNKNGGRVLNGADGKKTVVRVAAKVEDSQAAASKPATKDKGWFYNTFVADQTMDAKLAKFQGDVKARNGFVGSWFQDSFKYTAWVEVHRALTERGLQDCDCQEAYERLASGAAIAIDIRQADEYERLHAQGARSAPLFRLIQGTELKDNLRRLGYALITDFKGTERNPNFIAAATAAVNNDKTRQVIVYCSIGGTLQTFVERKGPKAKKYNDPERLFGRQSRSLKAIYELQQAGFTNVVHMKDGLNQWMHLDLPLEAVD
jgi:rhodanese-related sulfurtransferase